MFLSFVLKLEDCRPCQAKALTSQHTQFSDAHRLPYPRDTTTWEEVAICFSVHWYKSDRSCLLGLEGLEGVNLNVLDKGVELLLGLFVLVTLACDSDANSTGDVSDASGPDLSVEKGINVHSLYSVIQTPDKTSAPSILKNSTALATPEGAFSGAVREEPNPLIIRVKVAFETGDGACGSMCDL